MKTQYFLCITICFSIFFTLTCFSRPVLAADFNTSATFTANDVSTVASGDSRTLTLSDEFWGLNWNVAGGIGNPVYGDGDTSNDNTGYYIGIETDGRIGVYAEAYYDYGTMDINAPLDINMHTSDSGATTTVNTDYSILSGAGFSTTGASGSVDVGFLADARFAYTAAASFLGEGISTHNSYDPLVNVSLFEASVAYGQTYLNANTYGVLDFGADLPDAASTEGSVTTASGLSGLVDASTRTASTSQTDSVLTVTGDLDWLATLLTSVPLSVNPSLSNETLGIDIGITATALDVELVGEISLNRNFDVTMTPSVHLEFDRPVFIDGISGPVNNVSALLGSEIDIISQDVIGVTTTYSLNWSIRNRTSVDTDASLNLTAGELSASVKLPGIDRFDPPSLGPLYSDTFTTPSIGVDIYNERWSLSGEDIAGANFLLNFDSRLVDMLNRSLDETTNTFTETPASIAARGTLGTIIQEKNTTPDPDAPKDLFTENQDLYWFLASNYNLDNSSERVNWISGGSDRYEFYEILLAYDVTNTEYFQFLLDDSFELGIDFQPLLEDGLITGLMASFYSLEYQTPDSSCTFCPDPELETLLSNLGLDNLIGTSLAFFYNDIVDMTDLTVYQNAVGSPASFAYAYSSLEQYIETPVPEPATILMFGIGLLSLSWYSRRRHIL